MQSHPNLHHESNSPYPRASKPFLRWAGGKQRLVPVLKKLLPPGQRLIEPFVGAGAVSLSCRFEKYLVNDANPDLISIWTSLKYRPAEFINSASNFFSPEHWSQDTYLRVRDEFNMESDRYQRAVRLIYLNKFGFNGLYRVNREGRFNVPYGYPAKMPTFPAEALQLAAMKMEAFDVRCGGYGHIIELAGPGDVVYCDPPYLSDKDEDSSFAYTVNKFGMTEFRHLVVLCEQAALRGARVIVSQVDNVNARLALRNWSIVPIEVHSSIASSVTSRKLRRELIALTV
jgi:DNA adenine methylase